MSFAGFPARGQATAVPNAFFTDVLPALAGDHAALLVALHAMRLLQLRRGTPRFLREGELAADASLARALDAAGLPRESIAPALGRAVQCGVLLALEVQRDARRERLYFLNAPADKRALEGVRAAGRVEGLGAVTATAPPPAERPTIFALYESVIGTLSPLIAEELMEAERLYPAEWLERAFREAAARNARSWRYVTAILERWAIEGPGHAEAGRDPGPDGRYFGGRFGRIIKQRLGG